MSFFFENSLTWLQSLALKILKTGRVPRHVAIIMDGNRRFARSQGIDKSDGHKKGFDKLAETMTWIMQMGIPEVTVYAFSIENFKRSEEEVQAIMDLAKEKFQKLLDEKDKLMENGVRVKVIGNYSLIPSDLKAIIHKIVELTRNNDKACLSVALCYTSRDEITNTVKDIVQGTKKGKISIDDIDENVFAKCLYTLESSKLDLIIRTSGEVRLSDFLMWQASSTCVYFTKALWPEFGVWDFIRALFYYQRCYCDLEKLKKGEEDGKLISNQVSNFISNLQSSREAILANH